MKGLIKVSGPDARDFLHRLTTQDIKNMKDGQTLASAFLNANSTIVSVFDVTLKDSSFFLKTSKNQIAKLFEALEKFHFAENLEIQNLTENSSVADKDLELHKLQQAEKGLFEFGTDITEKNLVLEAPLAHAVSRDKGCYPGQEVVERVFTYGKIAKRLVGLSVEMVSGAPAAGPFAAGQKIQGDGKDVGFVTSAHFLPWKKTWVIFAIINKTHYDAGQTVEIMPDKSKAEVFLLPNTFEMPI